MTAPQSEFKGSLICVPLQRMTQVLLQAVTDTLALLVAALSVFAGKQTPIMAILLMLLIEVHAPDPSAMSKCVPDSICPMDSPFPSMQISSIGVL